MSKKIFIFIIGLLIISCTNTKRESTTNDTPELIKNEKVKSFEISDIKNPNIATIIDSITNDKKFNLSKCQECLPPLFRNDTLFGITDFNKQMMFFNKNEKLGNYSIEAYKILVEEVDYKNEIDSTEYRVFLWSFDNKKSEKAFEKQIPFYHRKLWKNKFHSKVMNRDNEWIQIEEKW